MTRNPRRRGRPPLVAAVASAAIAVAAVATVATSSNEARAHAMAPAGVHITESPDDPSAIRIVVRRSVVAASGAPAVLDARLGDDCVTAPAAGRTEDDVRIEERTLRCAGGVAGRTVVLMGLDGGRVDAVVRVTRADGGVVETLLSPGRATWSIPAESSAWETLGRYLALGVDHLLTGVDHVFFVLALLLIVRGRRRVIMTVTAFTVGHSVTLVLAALELVSLPSGPVELCIAASVVLLAAEAMRRDGVEGLLTRRPMAVAGGFGLVHGLGFAGALSETGLPPDAVPLALAAFNVGLELAQIGLVLVAWALVAALRHLEVPLAVGRAAVGYSVGVIAAAWTIERGLGLLG